MADTGRKVSRRAQGTGVIPQEGTLIAATPEVGAAGGDGGSGAIGREARGRRGASGITPRFQLVELGHEVRCHQATDGGEC